MKEIKKLHRSKANHFCRLIKGLFLFLLSVQCLHADPQLVDLHSFVEAKQKKIHDYEQVGDYVTALEIAQQNNKQLQENELLKSNHSFLSIISDLENKLLTLGYSRLIFDENYQPRFKLLQLLKLLGMEELNPAEEAILQINQWTQKNLLRQGERWQEQSNKFEKHSSKISSFLDELGFVKATLPHFKNYQGAIVHGAQLSRVRLRLDYLIKQWEKGIRFSYLYFLSGERPLDEQQENTNALLSDSDSLLKIRKNWLKPLEFPKTECEMIQLVWEQSEVPEEMRQQVYVYFVNAPMKKDSKSEKLLRPTTDDTVEAWLKCIPPQGRYLAVTNAPYTNRQDLVTRTIAPQGYSFETIGPEASEQTKSVIILDELARFIYQIKQRYENH
jgi:hypothetical protein